MNKDLLLALDHIEREKGISKDILFAGIEAALVSAAKKMINTENKEGITVTIDRETGEMKVFSEGQEITAPNFGRIAAQTAKQVIIQKIREAERQVIFDEYTHKVGDLVTGSVHRFERGDIIVDLGKTEGVLPRREQNPKERYKQGNRIRAYVLDVEKTAKGPQIILSRTHTSFVRRLFELEVPEIADGIVEIKAIARDPGDRTKIAVFSKDSKVDPVGACVGMRGNRVKGIVNELKGERIDIVRWSDDLRELIRNSLNPAELSSIKIDKDNNVVEVLVAEDQLSLAIGKYGQNVRTASHLLGMQIDIKGVDSEGNIIAKDKEASAESDAKAEEDVFPDIPGVGAKTREALTEAGYGSLEKLRGATVKDLKSVSGVGPKLAEKIVESVSKEKEKDE